MTKIIMMVGPPCSGKSTIAKKLVKQDYSYIRVNRDDLRFMMRGSWTKERFIEDSINKVTVTLIDAALKAGKSVILDATHLKEKGFKEIRDLAKKYEKFFPVDVEFMICDIPYWKQRWRNFWRCIRTGIWIPKDVSKNMERNFRVIKKKIEEGKI